MNFIKKHPYLFFELIGIILAILVPLLYENGIIENLDSAVVMFIILMVYIIVVPFLIKFMRCKNQEKQDIVLKNELGFFRLKNSHYEGSINYFDKVCEIIIELKSDNVSIQCEFDKLKSIVDDLEEWDKNLKKFVVDEIYLTGLSLFKGDNNFVTEEDYYNSLSVDSIIILENGNMCIGLNDSNIFFGASIEVYIDDKGNLFDVQVVS